MKCIHFFLQNFSLKEFCKGEKWSPNISRMGQSRHKSVCVVSSRYTRMRRYTCLQLKPDHIGRCVASKHCEWSNRWCWWNDMGSALIPPYCHLYGLNHTGTGIWVFNRNLMPMFITDWRCDSLPQTIIYVDRCFSHFIFAVKPLFQIEWNSILKGKPGWISIPVISLLGCFPSTCLFPSLGKLKRTVCSVNWEEMPSVFTPSLW